MSNKLNSKKKYRGNLNLHWPLKRAKLTRGFNPREKNHFGIDLAAPRGSYVTASHAGKVIYAGSGFRGYGRLAVLESEDGYVSFYAHLDKFLSYEGNYLNPGDLIGTVGSSGNARGVHLHFELKINNNSVDPLNYLP